MDIDTKVVRVEAALANMDTNRLGDLVQVGLGQTSLTDVDGPELLNITVRTVVRVSETVKILRVVIAVKVFGCAEIKSEREEELEVPVSRLAKLALEPIDEKMVVFLKSCVELVLERGVEMVLVDELCSSGRVVADRVIVVKLGVLVVNLVDVLPAESDSVDCLS